VNPVLQAGILIGAGCALWTLVMGLTGWYKDPQLLNVFFLVVVIEIAGLIWGLRRTAAEGRTYSGQVVAGTMMAAIAGVIIFCASLLFTTVLYPEYFDEINAMSREIMTKAGRSEAEIATALQEVAPLQTPLANAFTGFVGTFVTGVVASAIIGVWIRERRG
jgi:hypothetical protein